MNNRDKSKLHLLLSILDGRSPLTEELQQYLYHLDRGYTGERIFDEVLTGLTCDHLILRDLRLRLDNNFFQIDTLLISGKQVIVFELKNWGGNFEYRNGQFVSVRSNKPYKNPMEQLGRCVANLDYLLKKWQFNFEVMGRVVFIDPSFYLYNTPLDQPFLFVAHLDEWVRGLNRYSGWVGESHQRLAEKLIACDSPAKIDYDILPSYSMSSLQKGITCGTCHSFLIEVVGQRVCCLECGGKEKAALTIARLAHELELLFPNERLTSSRIQVYSGNKFSRRRIGRSLAKTYRMIGQKRYAYYVYEPFRD